MSSKLADFLLVVSLLAMAFVAPIPQGSTEELHVTSDTDDLRKWQTFHIQKYGVQVEYATFGIKSRVVEGTNGYDFEFRSNDKKSFRRIFSIWTHRVDIGQTASVQEDLLASNGRTGIYYFFLRNGPDANDLNKVDDWYRRGGRPKAKFISQS